MTTLFKPGIVVYHKETRKKGRILNSAPRIIENGRILNPGAWLVTWEDGHGRAYNEDELLTQKEMEKNKKKK